MTHDEALFSARASALYDAALDPARWPDALAGVADAVGPGGRACLFVERRPRDYAWVVPARLESAAVAAFAGHYADLDPMLAAMGDAPLGHVVHSAAVQTRAQQACSEFYVDFAWPHGMPVCRMVVVRRAPGLVTKLACTTDDRRDRDRRPARDALARLAAHVRRAAPLPELWGVRGAARDGALGALGRLGGAVLATDAEGRVAFATAAAEALLADGDALTVEAGAHLGARGRLRAALPRETAALRRLIVEAAAVAVSAGERPRRSAPAGAGGAPGGALTLPRPGRGPLTVTVAPLRRAAAAPAGPNAAALGSAAGGAVAAAALVCVSEPGAAAGALGARLRAAYGLTAAESRVAEGLAAGRSVREVAEAAGVAIGTVRNQIKQVFAKTGVRRQSELVLAMLETRRR